MFGYRCFVAVLVFVVGAMIAFLGEEEPLLDSTAADRTSTKWKRMRNSNNNNNNNKTEYDDDWLPFESRHVDDDWLPFDSVDEYEDCRDEDAGDTSTGAEDTAAADADADTDADADIDNEIDIDVNDADFHVDFDPSLDLTELRNKGYNRLPSDKWVQQCEEAIKRNGTIFKPFVNYRHKAEEKPRHTYRLGDCVRLCDPCEPPGVKVEEGTFAQHYNELACHGFEDKSLRTSNWDVLEEIMHMYELDEKLRAGFVKPDPDAVVIHLRLGDVIEHGKPLQGGNMSAATLLLHGGGAMHPGYHVAMKKHVPGVDPMTIYPIKEYYRALTQIHAQKVVINGGSHMPQFFQISKPYAHCLARGLAFAGLQVELRIDRGEFADKDFYYMTHAKKIIMSAGGFSRIIGEMVQHLGGQVVDSGRLPKLGKGFVRRN